MASFVPQSGHASSAQWAGQAHQKIATPGRWRPGRARQTKHRDEIMPTADSSLTLRRE
jgi:hypothetical protein